MTRTPTVAVAQGLDSHFGIPHFFSPLILRIVEETGLPAGFAEFADTEAQANVIRLYENFVVTGLFQNEDYARAVLRAAERPDKLESQVQTRMARQGLLRRDNPPMVIALIDECALRRPFGGPEVMRKQYEHLLALIQDQKIALQIVPADAGICPEAAFELLSIEGSHTIGYAEVAGGRGHLIEDDAHVAELEVLFELIRRKAMSAAESEQMTRDLLEQP
jgi:hypothetical protein